MTTAVHFPQAEEGKRFCQFFAHRYSFIEAPINGKERPEWKTISAYPIEHRNLWNRFKSPDTLIGLSFGSTTNYAMIDLDRGSVYHPYNDEAAFKRLLGAYEDVGFNDHLLLQSSWSEGMHLYFPLPRAVPTHKLAVMMKLIPIRAGFIVKDGTLEIFPNAKPYNKEKPTPYKAHRLPLQVGSYLLDKDYQPYSNNITTFLNQAEQAAQNQDIELIETAIEAAYQAKAFRYIKGDSTKAEAFKRDLKEQIEEGWTDFHQTNDLLRIIGTYGRVFEGLEGNALADYIAKTAQELPSYREFCRHQHHIERRALEWARCIEKFYYPYGTPPNRVGTFAEMKKEARENTVNLNRATESRERIVKAINYLKETVKQLPEKIGELKEMLLNAISQLFGTRPSDKTLSKYRDLWHTKATEAKVVEVIETTKETSSQDLELDENSHVNRNELITIPCEIEIVLDTTLEESIPYEVENILCEENTILAPLATLITTDVEEKIVEKNPSKLENLSQLAEYNIRQVKPIPHNGSILCPTPPNVIPSPKDEVKELESLSDKDFKKSATPPPVYEGLGEMIKSWFAQKITLSYYGEQVLGLAKASNEKRETLKSISPYQKVIITDYTHSSFLFNPENRENILVYVTPVSEINNWNMGIAVRAIYLFPLDT